MSTFLQISHLLCFLYLVAVTFFSAEPEGFLTLLVNGIDHIFYVRNHVTS